MSGEGGDHGWSFACPGDRAACGVCGRFRGLAGGAWLHAIVGGEPASGDGPAEPLAGGQRAGAGGADRSSITRATNPIIATNQRPQPPGYPSPLIPTERVSLGYYSRVAFGSAMVQRSTGDDRRFCWCASFLAATGIPFPDARTGSQPRRVSPPRLPPSISVACSERRTQ